MYRTLTKNTIRSAILICLCFLVTSTGWLAWEYHLFDQIAPTASDICTMVVGYLLQAAGIGVYAVILRRKRELADKIMPTVLVMHMLFMVPSVLSPFTAGTLVFGFLMNLICGIIAGYYLYDLAENADGSARALAFGAGYAAAIIATWLMAALVPQIYYSSFVLIICAVITALTLIVLLKMRPQESEDRKSAVPLRQKDRNLMLLAGGVVFLFSLVNSSGFAFPAADLGSRVNPEVSRLVYALGLIIASVVTDRNRRYGAVCALSALMIPFIILALRGETVPTIIFWALGYFAFGFYAVFRIITFSDLSAEKNIVWLSGFGLLIGRIGDALGECICVALAKRTTGLVIVTAVLFVLSVVLFFGSYTRIYLDREKPRTEKEIFSEFSAQHDLSLREQDMLRLILERKTNSEIADDLCISENTVKFHVKNLLQKTGCRNRNELVTEYMRISAQ